MSTPIIQLSSSTGDTSTTSPKLQLLGSMGIDTTDATATASDIAKDKTAYVNGKKVTGTHECSEGTGTGTCSGEHIIEVEELPSTETVITWDGDTTGREDYNNFAYLVTDKTFAIDELQGGIATLNNGTQYELVWSEDDNGEILGKYDALNIVVITLDGTYFVWYNESSFLSSLTLPNASGDIDKNAIYKTEVTAPFSAIIAVDSSQGPIDLGALYAQYGIATFEYYTVATRPTEDIKLCDSTNQVFPWYYIEDENDVLICVPNADTGENAWVSFGGAFMGSEEEPVPFLGRVYDMSEATSTEGYYILGGGTLIAYYQYVDGAWRERIIPDGSITLTKQGEHDVAKFATAIVDIVNTDPTVHFAKTSSDLPSGVVDGSLGIVTHGSSVGERVCVPISWSGLTRLYGQYIWTDGTNIYYSNGTDQYILNKETSTWESKIWAGLTSFSGSNIWTDGTNIYYSANNNQYVLNGDTWETKVWSGLTSFVGSYIWTDGTNIYYSNGTDQYILNKETSTWESKIWAGLTSFSADYIWTDGTDYYYSYAATSHHVLDKETSTWETKNWSGRPSYLYGNDIWTDGTDIYYSYGTTQCVLNKETSTWQGVNWNTSFSGNGVWTDGTKVYFSNYSTQYLLAPSPTLWSYVNGSWTEVDNIGDYVLTTKQVSENGTYPAASEGVNGFSSFTVAVPTIYEANSLDELPSDAVEGSIATIWEVIE